MPVNRWGNIHCQFLFASIASTIRSSFSMFPGWYFKFKVKIKDKNANSWTLLKVSLHSNLDSKSFLFSWMYGMLSILYNVILFAIYYLMALLKLCSCRATFSQNVNSYIWLILLTDQPTYRAATSRQCVMRSIIQMTFSPLKRFTLEFCTRDQGKQPLSLYLRLDWHRCFNVTRVITNDRLV